MEEFISGTTENRNLTPDEIMLLADLIAVEADHYTVLGLNRKATAEEIGQAYRLAIEHFHPNVHRDVAEADGVSRWKLSNAFQRVQEAYSVLSNRKRKAAYDDTTIRQLMVSHRSSALLGQIKLDTNLETRSLIIPAGAMADLDCGPSDIRDNVADKQDKSTGRERRRVERVDLKLPVLVTFEHNWQELTLSKDVSPLGIRFSLSHKVEPGSLVRLELPMPRYLRTQGFDEKLYVKNAYVIYLVREESDRLAVAEFI